MIFSRRRLAAALVAALSGPARADDPMPEDLMRIAMDAEPRVVEFLRFIGAPMDPVMPVMDPIGLMDSFESRRKTQADLLARRGLALGGPEKDKAWKSFAAAFLSDVNGTPLRPFDGSPADLKNFAVALFRGPFSQALQDRFGGEGVLCYQPSFDVRTYSTTEDYMNQARPASLRAGRGKDTLFLEPTDKPGRFVIHVLDRPGQDRTKADLLHGIVREVARGTLACIPQEWAARPLRPEYTEALINAFLEESMTGPHAAPFAAAAVLRQLNSIQDSQSRWWAEVIVNRLVAAAGAVPSADRRVTLHKVIYSLDRVTGDVAGLVLGVANLAAAEGVLEKETRDRRPLCLVLDAGLIPFRKDERAKLIDFLTSLKGVTCVVVGEEKNLGRLRKAFENAPQERFTITAGLVLEDDDRRLDLSATAGHMPGRSPRVFTQPDTAVTGLKNVKPIYIQTPADLQDRLQFLSDQGELTPATTAAR